MVQFDVKKIDLEGMENLEVIAKADRFNHWMYDVIKPFCHGNILEIGSGIGNISQFFIEAGNQITLSDLRENYCQVLQNKFGHKNNLRGIMQIDIIDVNFDEKHGDLFGTFDSIYALNIVEHVKDDKLALANCKKLLKDGGNLVILVPAYQSLYNNFDKELEHYRRYTSNSLRQVFHENNFKIIHNQYFNLAAIAGWFVSGTIFRNKTIPNDQMKLYNSLVPFFKLLDKVVFNTIGISVIQVGKK